MTRPVATPEYEFLDRKAVAGMGFGRQDVDRLFRRLDVIHLGGRKVYVKRADLERLLTEETYPADGSRVRACHRP